MTTEKANPRHLARPVQQLYTNTLLDVSTRLVAAAIMINSGRGENARQSLDGARSALSTLRKAAGVTVLGVMYVVLLGGHLVALRTGFSAQLSKHLLAFFFLVLMGSDAAAYYGGRAFGKHKLAPSVSPGKTWEGAVAGMLASLLLAVGAHYWFFAELPLRFALPLAAVMNVVGVLGDLTESALKRSAGAKDTAQILPGHGGMLDRMDSLLFNAPLIYYFARFYFLADR